MNARTLDFQFVRVGCRLKGRMACAALLVLALGPAAVGPAQAQLNSPPAPLIPIYSHPDPATTGSSFYPVAQAYAVGSPGGNGTWSGEQLRRRATDAVAGVLSLAAKNGGLDADAFATYRSVVERSPVVISTRLTINRPGSINYPSVFGAQTLWQSAAATTRTWWLLLGNQPGTTYTLDVQVRCISLTTGRQVDHIDRYVWKVVSSFESLRRVIDAQHTIPIGVAGYSSIGRETIYAQMHGLVNTMETQSRAGNRAGAVATLATLVTLIQNGLVSGELISTPEHVGAYAILAELEYIEAYVL